MKHKFLIAAGLLALGASPAFAFTIPAMKPDMAKAVKEIWADQMAAQQPSPIATGEAWMAPVKSAGKAATLRKAAFDGPGKPGDMLGKPDDALAAVPPKASTDTTLAGEMGNAGAAPAPASQYTGMGGPLEEVNYPPCSRTVTDRCIQLYERGRQR